MKRFLLPLLFAARLAFAAPDLSPSEYYTVETIKTPPGLSPEIGGLAFAPDGRLVACFHRGEVYTYDPAKQEWKLFAQGLHDPLGVLAPKNDEVIVMQRPELTRLRDTDGDGAADSYETICDAFGMSGNYHEFAFGPLAAPDGGWFAALNTASNGSGVRAEMRGEYRERGREGRMYSVVPWRGWVVKISPDGKLTPWASGFRSPNGLGYDAQGRLFVPDNEGDWIGSSPLYHVEKGKFYGHPAALTWKPGDTREPLKIPIQELDKTRTRPSIVFPQHTMANSPTQPLLDDHGLRKGNNRLAFAPDGSLWVGQTDHGWPGDRGLQRITWTGKVPLDVKEMHLTKTGFELTFTRPLEPSIASKAESYKGQRYYYEYHAAYGSPQMDLQPFEPVSATLSEDRTKVTLEFDPLVAWRIYEFDLKALKAEDGAAIANPLAIYTLNHLLNGTPPPPPPGGVVGEEKEKPKTKDKGKKKPAESAPAEEEKTAESKPAEKPATDKEKKTPAATKPEKAPETKPADKKPPTATPAPKPAATPAPATPPPATPAKKKAAPPKVGKP